MENKQFEVKGEEGPSPKNEDKEYAALRTAMHEWSEIEVEIIKMLAVNLKLKEADRIALEKQVSRMDDAIKKAERALDELKNLAKK